MNLDKEYVIELFDIYRSLLTGKQSSYFEMYYFKDYSLGEIACDLKISRNAVFDQIKRTEGILLDYEQKLGIYAKNKERISLIETYEEAYQIDLEKLKNV